MNKHSVPQPQATNNPFCIELIREMDGVLYLTIDGRPSVVDVFDKTLRWQGTALFPRGPMVEDLAIVSAVRAEFHLAYFCVATNFAAAWNGSEVVE